MRTSFHVFANNHTVDNAAVSDNCADLDNMLTDLNVEVSDSELKEELHPVPRKRKVHTKLHSMTLCFLRYQNLMSLRSGNPPRRKGMIE